PFTRFWYGGPKGWDGKNISGHFYTAWDAENLYFAVVVKDDALVSRYNNVDIWTDDNIMLGLYPWGWQVGDPLKGGYFRAHLGRCKDGKARIFRIGNPEGAKVNAEACPIVVKSTKDGVIYEWAYPRDYIAPLKLKAGERFRLSMMVMDTDLGADGKVKRAGIQIGGFNENVDARPIRWREFLLTD
ncbi:MAG: sugar-binding protein, partial [Planctomycetota bacterium]